MDTPFSRAWDPGKARQTYPHVEGCFENVHMCFVFRVTHGTLGAMKLRNTRKWAEGKPVLLAAMSAELAFMAEQAYGLMMALRHSSEFRSAFRIENPQAWLTLYRRHRFIEMTFIREHLGMCESFTPPGLMRDALGTYAETGKVPVCSVPQECVIEQLEAVERTLSDGIWRNIEDDLRRRRTESDEQRLEEWRNLSSQESTFWLRVMLPCWLEYGMSAAQLLREARHGDIQAIDRILRLDECALQDPRIMLHFSEAKRNPAKGRFKRMHAAIGNLPERKLTPKNAKECVGAFISRFSENLGARVSGPDIRRLYDAIAQDVHGTQIDLDFADEDPESFSRMIRRHRPFWEPLFKSGWPLLPNPA